MSKQTAVEWLQEAFEHTILTHDQVMQTIGLFEQAKAMHKREIIAARQNGVSDAISKGYTMSHEDYYNETYGK